jgi:hypothetical protein
MGFANEILFRCQKVAKLLKVSKSCILEAKGLFIEIYGVFFVTK